MIKGIKHIIFDLGGVLLNIDYNLTEQAFKDLGISNFHELYSQLQQTNLFNDLEIGKINRYEFAAQLRALTNIELNDEQIFLAWNAMLLNFPLRRLQILQQMRLYYDLVLLSNTNEIHEEAFTQHFKNNYTVSITTFFDKVYFSHHMGMRKPSAEIFQHILAELNFAPAHTLFIDDSPQHIEAASALGIQTIYLKKGMTIEKDIFLPKGSKS